MAHPTVPRYLQSFIESDAIAEGKIAFVSGPRQVGKTSLAKAIIHDQPQLSGGYYTWDDDEFRVLWSRNPKAIFESHGLVVLDEIHKDKNWKRRLKGLFDLYSDQSRMVVTGSARLDFFRKSGDSLQGRYLPYRLHPFSLNETPKIPEPPADEWEGQLKTEYDFDSLLKLGGFPDPLFGQSDAKAQRWRRLYRERMIREDLRDLKELKDLEQLKTLSILLETGVGSGLSYESLRQDLQVSFDTVKSWIELLEAVYFCFRIRPYSTGVRASLRKEPKLYLMDWSYLSDEGARFENFIACHLLKSCQAWTDSAKGEFELHYVRDKQKREVDFLVTRDKKPWLLVEVKSGNSNPTPALMHYTEVLKPKFSIQVVRDRKHERKIMAHPKIQVLEVHRFLSRLV